MYPVVIVACGILGLCIGSFLNVVIYRVPLGRSILRPPSACPSCQTLLRPTDNIPVVSWLILGGRCRICKTRVSIRYPLVEALTAVLFLLTAIRFGTSWTLLGELAFVAGSIALAAVDLERYLLPKRIVYPTLVLVAAGLLAAAGLTHDWHRLGVAALCSVGAFALFFAMHTARPEWLGFGDVRLAAVLGLALGWVGAWYLLVGFMAANILGAAVGIGLMAAKRASRHTALPYGVFLAAGAWTSLLVGAEIISWYSRTVTHRA